MIQITITYTCHRCGSQEIVKNRTNKCGNAQYHCNNWGAYRVLEPKRPYSETDKQTILKIYLERTSLRGLERIFGVCRQTVARWITSVVKALPPLEDTVIPAQPSGCVRTGRNLVICRQKSGECAREINLDRQCHTTFLLIFLGRYGTQR